MLKAGATKRWQTLIRGSTGIETGKPEKRRVAAIRQWRNLTRGSIGIEIDKRERRSRIKVLEARRTMHELQNGMVAPRPGLLDQTGMVVAAQIMFRVGSQVRSMSVQDGRLRKTRDGTIKPCGSFADVIERKLRDSCEKDSKLRTGATTKLCGTFAGVIEKKQKNFFGKGSRVREDGTLGQRAIENGIGDQIL